MLILTRQSSPESKRPNLIAGSHALAQLDFAQIDPALSLTGLGGLPEAEVVTEAINKARPETALATLLFTPGLNSRETTGGFLQLAQKYAMGDNRPKPVQYRMAGGRRLWPE